MIFTYSNPPSFTCPKCGMTSFNPNDISQGYCGACHGWTSALSLGGVLTTDLFPPHNLYFARNGTPIDMTQWGILHSDFNYVNVIKWEKDGIQISTVWLGIDHSFGLGKPLIFETMIFGPDDYPYHQTYTRYATEEQAREGHDRTVKNLEAGETPWFCEESDV